MDNTQPVMSLSTVKEDALAQLFTKPMGFKCICQRGELHKMELGKRGGKKMLVQQFLLAHTYTVSFSLSL